MAFAKVIDVVKGNHYFAVRCPTTGKVLAIDVDTSHGWATYILPDVVANCPDCQKAHQFPGSAVFSFQADGSE